MPETPKYLPGISYVFSGLVRLLSQKTPGKIQQLIISRAMNHAFSAEIHQGDFSFLEGRSALIEVPDLNIFFNVTLNRGRLSVAVPPSTAEVRLRADLQSLLDIINRTADPDTLFFQRKLLITGDTELGLELKNLLDRIEPEDRLPSLLNYFLIVIHKNQQSRY